MFLKRSYKKEMMDDFSLDDSRIDVALNELKIINKYLGGNSVTKKGLKKILPGITSENSVKILDVGGGASNILQSVKNFKLKIFSVDLSKRTAKFVKQNSSEVEIVCADVFKLPFKAKQFDIIHLSLFLHHFNKEEIGKILLIVSEITRFGIIINDLQRSFFAWIGIKILTTIFSKSEFVRNDGPLSVKKGFIRSELVEILDELNFNYEISYKWAFRWLVVVYL